jgi:hypothetical protein
VLTGVRQCSQVLTYVARRGTEHTPLEKLHAWNRGAGCSSNGGSSYFLKRRASRPASEAFDFCPLRPRMEHVDCCRERVECTTEDGCTLVLWKCFDTAPSSSLAATSPAPEGGHRRRHHIVLCHGLGSNRFTFDLSRDVSVVDFLVAKGWTTWLVDLRGAKRQALSVLLIWYCIFSFRQALLTLESIARWR